MTVSHTLVAAAISWVSASTSAPYTDTMHSSSNRLLPKLQPQQEIIVISEFTYACQSSSSCHTASCLCSFNAVSISVINNHSALPTCGFSNGATRLQLYTTPNGSHATAASSCRQRQQQDLSSSISLERFRQKQTQRRGMLWLDCCCKPLRPLERWRRAHCNYFSDDSMTPLRLRRHNLLQLQRQFYELQLFRSQHEHIHLTQRAHVGAISGQLQRRRCLLLQQQLLPTTSSFSIHPRDGIHTSH
jgi:hypothetical protein